MSYLSTLVDSSTPPDPESLIQFAQHLLTSSSVPLVVGRQALELFVLFLCGGSGVDLSLIRPPSGQATNTSTTDTNNGDASETDQANSNSTSTTPNDPTKVLDEQELEWFQRGKTVFQGETGEECREKVVSQLVVQIPTLIHPGGWGEDQVGHFHSLCLASSPVIPEDRHIRLADVDRLALCSADDHAQVLALPHSRDPGRMGIGSSDAFVHPARIGEQVSGVFTFGLYSLVRGHGETGTSYVTS